MWSVIFLPEADKDMDRLSHSQRILVRKAIDKVSERPLPQSEGGYGKPLGNKRGLNLTGLLKIKLKESGIRIVYKLVRTETEMLIVVVGARADEEAYRLAHKRRIKYDV
jgi:mRNA interferase RelE/StbE